MVKNGEPEYTSDWIKIKFEKRDFIGMLYYASRARSDVPIEQLH